jgi:hypothetical protein
VHLIALVSLSRPQEKQAKSNKFNGFRPFPTLACKLQLSMRLLPEAWPGCHLTTLFGNTAVIAIATPKNPKKKHSLLPVLTVLFMVSYGLMTMLIVEQGSVIQSQGNLIKILNGDSRELWSMKGKAIGEKQMAKARSQNSAPAPSTQAQNPSRTPSSQSPSPQVPSTQAPSSQTPSTQGIQQQQHAPSRTGKALKHGTQAPPVPAEDLVDHRRSLVTI